MNKKKQETVTEEPMTLDEAKKPPEVASRIIAATRRKRYKNVGTSRIEVGHEVYLNPGEVTDIRPHRLDFYRSIGAVEVLDI